MRQPGDKIDIRYYGAFDQVSSLQGEVILWSDHGLLVRINGSTEQFFPWTSIQRVIAHY